MFLACASCVNIYIEGVLELLLDDLRSYFEGCTFSFPQIFIDPLDLLLMTFKPAFGQMNCVLFIRHHRMITMHKFASAHSK